MAFFDKTFCASPKCQNDCGRRMTDREQEQLIYLNRDRVEYSYFCGEPNPYFLTQDETVERI